MATAVGIGAAIIGVGTSIMGTMQAKDAEDDQKASIQRAANEKVRKIKKTRDAFVGELQAAAAGSGVDVSSRSLLEVRNDSLKEFELERKFTREAGAYGVQAADMEGDRAVWQGISSAAQSISQIAQTGQAAGWWG